METTHTNREPAMQNATQAETIRQFLALTPETIRVGRQTFKRAVTLTGDGNQVIFAWASKRKGAFVADKLVATVDYDEALDLYEIVVQRFDGVTFETSTTWDVAGATFNAFESIAVMAA